MVNKKTHIALLSGGRDSSAMVEFILNKKLPLDYILFNDTLLEFEEMYEYLDKFDKYLDKKYNKRITFNKPKSTFSKWVFGEVTKGERKGWIRGLPMLSVPCFWKRESKVYSTNRWVKDNNIKNPIYYVGFTYSEHGSRKSNDQEQIYPLIENKICEAGVDRILQSINMINPLYEFFYRTGCAICPYQPDRAFYVLMVKFPKKWELMKWYESELKELEKQGYKVVNSQWDDKRTILEMEEQFLNNKHRYSILSPVSCECKTIIPDNQMLIEFKKVL